MKEEWKVYIRGVEGRGKEVIKMLEDLGGKIKDDGHIKDNKYVIVDNEYIIFTIDHNGYISGVNIQSEMAKIIMDNYREIKLHGHWKDGDILVNKNANYKFCVFDDYLSRTGSGNDLFFFHCEVAGHKGERYLKSNSRRYFHDVNDYRIATPQEVEHFHEALHMYHKDWDAEKKEVIDWKWKPQIKERYYYIDNDGEIMSDTWGGFPTDDDRYNFGNCFRTEKEAKAMAEKVKKLLKGEL